MKIAHYTPGTVSSVRGLSLPFAASWENQAKAARAPPHGPPSPSAKSVGLGLEHTISFAVSQVSASEKKNDATTTHFCYWKKKHFFLGEGKKRVRKGSTRGNGGHSRQAAAGVDEQGGCGWCTAPHDDWCQLSFLCCMHPVAPPRTWYTRIRTHACRALGPSASQVVAAEC
jgi:hypothetical protein